MKRNGQLNVIAVACLTTIFVSACGSDASFFVNPPDTFPDSFGFIDQSGVAQNTIVESNSITITGIVAAAPIGIVGGEYSINGSNFTGASGSVNNGQSVVVRVTSASTANTTVNATLDIGGVTDVFSVTTLPDTTPPTAAIQYPPRRSLTEGTEVTVRGTAMDDLSAVVAVTINGFEAATNDGFATWSATVPLMHGDNAIVLDVQDSEQNINSNADSVTIERSSQPFDNPKALVVDGANSRALVLDRVNENTLFAVDLVTGERTVLFSDTIPAASNPFSSPRALALDAAGNRALVVDVDSTIIAVDLSTGVRTVLSNSTRPNSNNTFSGGTIAIDTANNRALVVAGLIGSVGYGVSAIDLITGERSIVSDPVTPNSNNPFSSPLAIAFDSSNNRALVVDVALRAVIAVDLTSGLRSVLSDDATPNNSVPFDAPISITVDSNNNRALILDVGAAGPAIIAVDLLTGARSMLSNNNLPNANVPFRNPQAIALDANNDRVLLAENSLGATAVFAVDLTTGERSSLSDSAIPNGDSPLTGPRSLAVDNVNDRVIVIDSWRGTSRPFSDRNAVFAVDLTTGLRSILSDNTTPSSINPLSAPEAIVVHDASNRALVVDRGLRAVLAVNLSTGERTVLSDDSTPNSPVILSIPIAIALDARNDRALVVDAGHRAVLAIDMNNGTRSVFIDEPALTAGNASSFPVAIAIDDPGNRALMLDNALGAVYSVDLDTGARAVLSDSTTPNASVPMDIPLDITVDHARGRAIVVDGFDALIAVDLETGERTRLSDNNFPNTDNRFFDPWAIDIDTNSNHVLVADLERAAIITVDPLSGDRVILSQD